MSVTLQVPGALAGYAGGRRRIELAVPLPPATVARVLDRLAQDLPALERRIRDERAEIRRHVNVYVDGADIRTLSGAQTPVPDGATVDVIAAVSGG
ncbi:MAG: MoaD/ThiS family protein [Actinocrinis sp.]